MSKLPHLCIVWFDYSLRHSVLVAEKHSMLSLCQIYAEPKRSHINFFEIRINTLIMKFIEIQSFRIWTALKLNEKKKAERNFLLHKEMWVHNEKSSTSIKTTDEMEKKTPTKQEFKNSEECLNLIFKRKTKAPSPT